MKRSFTFIFFLLIINMIMAANLNEQFSGTTFPPTGWTKFRGTNNIGTAYDWVRTTTRYRSAPACAYVAYENVSGGLAEDWLVTPQLMPSEGNSTLSFWIRDRYTTDYGSVITIRISTASQNVHSDFEIVDTYAEPGTTYINKTIDLSRYTGTPVYVAFVMTNDDGDDLYLDDVTGPAIYYGPVPPACAQIASPVNDATGVAINTNLTWNTSDMATGYKIFLGTDNPPTNIANGVDLGLVTTYDPAGDLNYLTTYYWKIVPYNTYGDAAGCDISHFTTVENPIVSVFPYHQNFDGVTEPNLPFGWTIENTNNDSRYWRTDNGSPRSSPNSMYITRSTSIAMNDWFFTPPLQLTGGTAYRVTFYYRSSTTNPEKLELKWGTGASSAQMTLGQLFNNSAITNTSYQQAVTTLLPAADGLYHLGWHGYSARSMNSLYVDDITIEEAFTLSGVVSNLSTGLPVEGASVSVPPFPNVTTLVDGHYTIPVTSGTYNITVTAPGYNAFHLDNYVISSSVTLDIQLTAPEVSIFPEVLTVDLPYPGTTMRYVNITNSGSGSLQYSTELSFNKSGSNTDYSSFTINPGELITEAGAMAPAKEPASGSSKDEVIIHYDGDNTNSIGTNSASSFIVAVRFTAAELAQYYADYQITGMQFYISQNYFTNVTAKIWKGGSLSGPSSEIYSTNITGSVAVDDWTIHYLGTPIPFEAGEEYWMGYSINATGGYPAGCDEGPAVSGKSQWIYFNGAWAELLALNNTLNYNWNIRGILDLLPVTPSWITVNPAEGQLLPGSETALEVGFSTETINTGNYTCDILIHTDPDIGQLSVPVNLHVYLPEIHGTITALDSGDPISGAQVEVSGHAPVSTGADGTWSVAVETGTYAVSVNKAGFNSINLTGIVVSDNYQLDFQMTRPVIEVNPRTAQFILEKGHQSNFGVEISNAGNGPSALTLSTDETWILVSLKNFGLQAGESGSVEVTVDATGLTAGMYYGSVEVLSDPEIESLAIDIELEVVDQIVNFHPLNPNQTTWWTAISTNHMPGKANVSEILAPIVNDMDIMMNSSGIYWPEHQINTIGEWNVYSGYKIKMHNPAQLTFSGPEVYPKTVNLNTGLNYLPVLSDEAVSADEVLAPVLSKMIYIFDIYNLKANWPAGGIHQIDFLEPGLAYFIVLTSPGSVNYENVTKQTGSNHFVQIPNKTGWNDPVHSDNYHLISILPSALQHLETGDYIGAFDASGNCTGYTVYAGQPAALPLFVNGDDFTTSEKDGMSDGESLTFRVFRPATSGEWELIPVFEASMPNADGLFTAGGLSGISELYQSTASISENELSKIKMYPNPTTGVVHFNLAGLTDVNLKVITIHGKELINRHVDQSETIDLTGLSSGVYFVEMESNGYKLTKTLIVQ